MTYLLTEVLRQVSLTPRCKERFDARRRQSRGALEKENHHETHYGTRIPDGVKQQSRVGPKGLNGERQRLNREKVSTLAPQEFQAPTDATRA